PHADAIDAMGDKLRARQAMQKAGVPFVPGGTEAIDDVAAAYKAAERYGLPLALKASGGGGGKGLKVARTVEEIESAFSTATREAEAYFKNGTIYAERYLDNPKHVELQILADKHGNVVHIGERDCSLQRRHQKLWEEAPAQIPSGVRDAMRDAGLRAARAINYDSVGTIECLVQGDEFFFLEMNTRIQVEHTVSEMISGIDLIREQIRVAAGEPLGFSQDDISFRGVAIEGRVNAEDPADNFRPAPGTLTAYREPAGLGVRIDSAAYPGMTISADYDSMIAKLIVWAPTREQAIARLRRATAEYEIRGVPTTLGLLNALCDHAPVRDATYGTATLEAFATSIAHPTETLSQSSAHVAESGESIVRVEVNGKLFSVRMLDGIMAQSAAKARPAKARKAARAATGNDIISPMHGAVVELRVAQGASVAAGDVVAVIEAMKMMNELRAHKAGTVATIHTAVGATIEANAPILTLL
ncbi:MAG: ATP-binding protein, partial [Vulcanimicrobiaceae bacterium]